MVSPQINYVKANVACSSEHPTKLKVAIPAHRKDWVDKVRTVPHAKFDKTHKYWTIPYSKQEMRCFHHLFKGETQYLFTINPNIPERFRDYYEKKHPLQKVVIQAAATTQYFNCFIPKEAEAWRDLVKKIPGRKWSAEHKCWLLPYVKYSFRELKKIFGSRLSIQMTINLNIPESYMPPPKPSTKKKTARNMSDGLNSYQLRALHALENELILERKSHRTIKTYKVNLIGLWKHYPTIKPSQITAQQIKAYMLYKIKTNHIAERTQTQIINALAAFYRRLLKQEDKLNLLKRPKRPKNLPNVFSKEEIERLLNNIRNLKHKTLLMLVYSSGLRKSEIKNLRKEDVLFDRNAIFVKCSKGKKDRYVMLSAKAAEVIKLYIGEYNPKFWLFEGVYGGQYGETSIQNIFVKAKQKANVNPNVTFHGLRHSFATHLVENNVPLHIVKDLLGHNSLKTTQVYLHISDKMRKTVQSPLDGLNI